MKIYEKGCNTDIDFYRNLYVNKPKEKADYEYIMEYDIETFANIFSEIENIYEIENITSFFSELTKVDLYNF